MKHSAGWLLILSLLSGAIYIRSGGLVATSMTTRSEMDVVLQALDILQGKDRYKFERNSVYGVFAAIMGAPVVYLQAQKDRIPIPEIGDNRFTDRALSIHEIAYADFFRYFRVINIGLSVISLCFIISCGQRMASIGVGLISAFALAAMPIHVYASSFVHPIIPFLLIQSLIFWLLLKPACCADLSPGSYLLLSFLAALSTAILYRGVLIFVMILSNLLWKDRRGFKQKGSFALKMVVLYCLGFFVLSSHMGADLPLRLEDLARGIMERRLYGPYPFEVLSGYLNSGIGLFTIVFVVLSLSTSQRNKYAIIYLYSVLYIVLFSEAISKFPEDMLPPVILLVIPAAETSLHVCKRALEKFGSFFLHQSTIYVCVAVLFLYPLSLQTAWGYAPPYMNYSQGVILLAEFHAEFSRENWKKTRLFDYGSWLASDSFLTKPIKNPYLSNLDHHTDHISIFRIPTYQYRILSTSELERPDMLANSPVWTKTWVQYLVAQRSYLIGIKFAARNSSDTSIPLKAELKDLDGNMLNVSDQIINPSKGFVDYLFSFDSLLTPGKRYLVVIHSQPIAGIELAASKDWYHEGFGRGALLQGAAWASPPNIPDFDFVFESVYK